MGRAEENVMDAISKARSSMTRRRGSKSEMNLFNSPFAQPLLKPRRLPGEQESLEPLEPLEPPESPEALAATRETRSRIVIVSNVALSRL